MVRFQIVELICIIVQCTEPSRTGTTNHNDAAYPRTGFFPEAIPELKQIIDLLF